MKLQNGTRFGSACLFAGLLIACSNVGAPLKAEIPSGPSAIGISIDTSSIPVNNGSDASTVGISTDPMSWARHAVLVFSWPKRTVQVIPIDTENVLFQALKLDGSLIASASVSRPANAATSSIVLPESQDSYLPIGRIVLFVQAKNGLNRVLAQASQSVEVIENQVINATLRLVAVSAVKVIMAVPSRTTIFVPGPDANAQINPTTVQLGATTTMSDATTNTLITWSTSNSGIAEVNASGLVSGVAAGTATITATSVDGKAFASISINVQTGGRINVTAE